jgi:hypothetical protein
MCDTFNGRAYANSACKPFGLANARETIDTEKGKKQ